MSKLAVNNSSISNLNTLLAEKKKKKKSAVNNNLINATIPYILYMDFDKKHDLVITLSNSALRISRVSQIH